MRNRRRLLAKPCDHSGNAGLCLKAHGLMQRTCDTYGYANLCNAHCAASNAIGPAERDLITLYSFGACLLEEAWDARFNP